MEKTESKLETNTIPSVEAHRDTKGTTDAFIVFFIKRIMEHFFDNHRNLQANFCRKHSAHHRRAFRKTARIGAAFTLVETMMAAVVVLIAMGSIFLVSSRCMGIVSRSQNVAVASAMLHERMQQLQATDWETLTDSESYKDQVWTDPEDGTTENVDGLLKSATQSGAALRDKGAVESLRASAYRPLTSAAPEPAAITVTRNSTTATLTSAETNLVDEKMVRIDLRLSWTDARMGIPCTRALSCVVARK